MPKEGTRSKGFCFIEYTTPEAAEMAISTMPGFNLKGRAIKVGRPTALGGQAATLPMLGTAKTGGVNAAEAGQIAAAMLLAKSDGQNSTAQQNAQESQNRIYVGCVPYSFTSEDVKQIFDVFGKILSCQLIPSNERPGTHRGYGFIEYSTFEEAKLAIETMNDFAVAGKILKVNHATALRGLGGPLPPTGTAALMQGAAATGANALPLMAASQYTVSPISSGTTPVLTAAQAAQAAQAVQAAHAVQAAQAIHASRPGQVVPQIGTVAQSIPTTIIQSVTYTASPILVLSDMVDVSEANDDLKEEIRQECLKYGKIQDITLAVDAPKNAVRIFVIFDTAKEAANAVPMLHERWFGGRRIQARQYDQNAYAAESYWL